MLARAEGLRTFWQGRGRLVCELACGALGKAREQHRVLLLAAVDHLRRHRVDDHRRHAAGDERLWIGVSYVDGVDVNGRRVVREPTEQMRQVRLAILVIERVDDRIIARTRRHELVNELVVGTGRAEDNNPPVAQHSR